MDLANYTAERGVAAQLARALNVSPVLVSQWASGARPIPEDRGPSIEFETGFRVPAEVSCPTTRWHRVVDPSWPNGKPLIDKTPLPPEPAPAAAPTERRGIAPHETHRELTPFAMGVDRRREHGDAELAVERTEGSG